MSTDPATPFLEDFYVRLETLVASVDPASFSGRGIVILAGGAQVFVNAYVLISVLRRHLHCTLPIEVWHFGGAELSPRMKNVLRALDVETVDAAPRIRETGADVRDAWQLKPFALLWSRFAEALLLDADQVPARDPAEVFEWPEYVRDGAVFWPDILDIRADNPVWPLLGLPAMQRVSLESGQVLVDKRRHGQALAATFLLNEQAETIYDLVYGDKDTFLLGWLLTGATHAVVPHRPFADDRTLTQRDFAGQVFLQHRTNCKWTYSGAPHSFRGIVHEEACLAALESLRAQWNGRIFTAPARSARARAAEEELVRRGRLGFEVVADDAFSVEFLPDGEIGEGRSADRQNWHVEDESAHASGIALVLTGVAGPSYRLSPEPDGAWSGERFRMPRSPIVAVGRETPIAPQLKPGERPGLVDTLLQAVNLGRSAEEDDALCRALILLARIEPDVEARLHMLANGKPSASADRTHLLALADAVAAAELPPLRPLRRPVHLFEQNYVAVPERPFGWQS